MDGTCNFDSILSVLRFEPIVEKINDMCFNSVIVISSPCFFGGCSFMVNSFIYRIIHQHPGEHSKLTIRLIVI